MTTTLPRRHLVDAVVAPSHSDYVRLEADGAVLRVVGADMYTMVVCELGEVRSGTHVPYYHDAYVTLPSKLLTATTKALQGDDVSVEIAPTRLRLRSGNYRGEIAAQGRLPQVQAVPDEMWRELSAAQATQLSSALRSCAVAALSDPARPAVSGVRLEVAGSMTTLVGTDGNRLHCVELRDVGVGESLTLPTQCVGAVCDALDEAAVKVVKTARPKKGAVVAVVAPIPSPSVRVAVGANNVAVEVLYGDLTSPLRRRLVFCRRAPEPFSEWRRIAEGGGAGCAVVVLKRDVLLQQLKSCPADAISLTATPQQLQLDYVVLDDTSTRRLGEGGCLVGVERVASNNAAPFATKLSTALLRDAVVQCGDEVEMLLAPSSPCRLRSGAFSAVVMFVR